MKIIRMNKGNFGKIKAFFDIETQEGFVIKGLKIVEGPTGLFVGKPSKQGKDGEWYDTITCTEDLGTELQEIATNFYNQGNQQAKVNDYTEINTKDSSDIPF
tara:strand:+ start:343 stop:648 length:306 start_codon:yes stop_codon:yes gene_type:complete